MAAQLAGRSGDATPRVAVARLDCAEYQETCSNFGVTGFPPMYLGTPQQFQELNNKDLSRINPPTRTSEAVVAAIEEQLHR